MSSLFVKGSEKQILVRSVLPQLASGLWLHLPEPSAVGATQAMLVMLVCSYLSSLSCKAH